MWIRIPSIQLAQRLYKLVETIAQVAIVGRTLEKTDEAMSGNIFKRGVNYLLTGDPRYHLYRFFNNFENTDTKEQKISIDGININYCRVGSGEHPVLMIPGFMGTILNNFGDQLENLDRKKMTLVCWDAPGYGKSIPPLRDFSDNYFVRDANYAKCLMNALGFETFSAIGWCQGGITALHLAARNTEAVRKLILIGTPSKIFIPEMTWLRKSRNVDTWGTRTMEVLAPIYGEKYVRKVCEMWIDRMLEICDNQDGEFEVDFKKIQCPTLIVHGDSDNIVDVKHAAVLREKIRVSRVHIMKNGSHNIHQRFSKEFNELATEFFLSSQDS